MTEEIKRDKRKGKKPIFRGIPIRVEINEDIDFELRNICEQRKITISRLVYEILKEWLENNDLKKFEQ